MITIQEIIDRLPDKMVEGITVVDIAELAVVIIAAGAAYWQIILHRNTTKSEHTKDLILQVLDSEMIRSFESKNNIWGTKLTATKSQKEILELNKIFNFFENIAVFVKNDLVDESLLLETLAPLMIRYEEWAHSYIVALRKRRKNKTLLKQYTDLMALWAFIRKQENVAKKLKNSEKITKFDVKVARADYPL